MPEISRITLPDGNTYTLKDSVARSGAGGGLLFRGVTTSNITDGSSLTTIEVDGQTITVENGDLVIKGTKEFVFSTVDNKWHEFGDNSPFGALAYADTASGIYTPAGTVSQPEFTGSQSSVTITTTANANGNYRPAGTVSQPTFTGTSSTFTGTFTPEGEVTVSTQSTTNQTTTVSPAESGTATYTPAGNVTAPTISVETAGMTANIHNPTAVNVVQTWRAAAPVDLNNPSTKLTDYVELYKVSNETLFLYQVGCTTAPSITTEDVSVKTGDAAYTASQPSFSGTGVRLVTGNIAVPNAYTASFTGSQHEVSVSGTPDGTISQPEFTGTTVQISGTTTAAGEVSQPTFNGTQATIQVSPD